MSAKIKQAWVFSEKKDLLLELVSAARQIAPEAEVTAFVSGPRETAELVARQGVQSVIWLGELAVERPLEEAASIIHQQVQRTMPDLIIIGATMRGRVIAGRVAACLDVSVYTDVRAVVEQADGYWVEHLIFGGGAVRSEPMAIHPAIITVAAGFARNEPNTKTIESAGILELRPGEPDKRVRVLDRRPRGTTTINLSAARRVVCPGRGVAKQDDLSMVEELASLMNAEVGCTRPLAEGLDWLPRERYIGISGAMIKPDFYLGVGVSGQVQHLIGMSESKVVVAINKDPAAPIFDQCDYGIAGDLYVVVPEIINALRARDT